MKAVVPSRIAVRMYQVGFGDCLLLTLAYPTPLEDGRSERHVLFDFGTTSLPNGRKNLDHVARSIGERTAGQLDAVVLTHRHRDHLSGFGRQAIADLLQSTAPPTLVVRPWTEDPEADERFTGEEGDAPGEASLGFVRALRDADAFAAAAAETIAPPGSQGLRRQLHMMAFDQVSNPAAVAQLDAWAKPDRGEHLHHGCPTRLESLLPGVRITVLGPPTIEQHPQVTRMRDVDQEEFWMLYRRLGEGLGGDLRAELKAAAEEAIEDERRALPSGPAQWLIEHLDRQQIGSYLRIVRILDDVLNNTSLILLFEIEGDGGMKRLLFCGDAQIEDWEFALKPPEDRAPLLDRLAEVDLYKVGHHGSRNATPRSLFSLWTGPGKGRDMVALMSTKDDVHGDSPATKVPRATLVDALRDRTDLFDTRSFDADQSFVEVSTDTASADGFSESALG